MSLRTPSRIPCYCDADVGRQLRYVDLALLLVRLIDRPLGEIRLLKEQRKTALNLMVVANFCTAARHSAS